METQRTPNSQSNVCLFFFFFLTHGCFFFPPEYQYPRAARAILRKKNGAGGVRLPDFYFYHYHISLSFTVNVEELVYTYWTFVLIFHYFFNLLQSGFHRHYFSKPFLSMIIMLPKVMDTSSNFLLIYC